MFATHLLTRNLHATVWQAETPQSLLLYGLGHLRRAFSIPKNYSMIAKINLDGKEHVAIVFDKSYSPEDVFRFRNAINSYMQYAEAAFCACTDYALHDENYSLHALMDEMKLTDEQENAILAYFGNHHFDGKQATKKTCEIYI